MGNVTIRDAGGTAFDVPEELVPQYVARGFALEAPEQQAQRLAAEQQAATYGGPVGTFAAAGLGAVRTVTGGLSDVALRGIGGQREAAALREENPIASTVGEVAGAFIPVGLPAVAGAAGKAIRAGASEAGLAGTLGRAALAGSAEGAMYGAGSGISEIALSDDPLTTERAASVLSSNMLFGGVAGGGIGLVGKAAELGLRRAATAIEAAVARKTVEDVSPDLAALDNKGLKGAREVEIDRIEAERAPLRKQLVEDIQDFRERIIETRMKDAAAEGLHLGEVREANAAFKRANLELRRALDDRAGLADRPESILKTLRTQEQAMSAIKEWGDGAIAGWDAKVKAIPEEIRAEILAGKSTIAPVPSALTPRGVDEAIEREMVKRYGSLHGPEFPKSLRTIDDVFEGAIAKNRQLQSRIAELTAPPASERLTQIEAAGEALHAPQPKSLGEHIVGMVAPYAGPVGAIAAAGTRAVGGLRKALGEAGQRAGKTVAQFLDTSARVAARAPLATKVLAGVRFGEERKQPTGESLPALFKARTDEVKALTAFDEAGVPRMLPEARLAVAGRLKAIGVADPILADRLETIAARRIEFLSSLIPRRPDVAGAAVGPDRWQPSDMEMRSWARSVAAVEDPHGVLERAASGNVTPEDIQAIRAVHPEILRDWITEVSSQLGTLRKTLPRERKTALSLLTGQPVDPAMDPAILRVLQAQYAYEPGPAPMAKPQFGSVKNRMEVGTPAQRREEGTA